MPYPETAEGFFIPHHDKFPNFEKQEFKLKQFEDRDIDIAIDACGVCASDCHTLSGGWAPLTKPICAGHEVIGRAIRVGPAVKTVKVGDRVGVGAQIAACLECDNCKADQENYCSKGMIDTYGTAYKDGTMSQGGFSSHMRAHEYFTFKIPENIPTEVAAPMLCAGITTYSPLVRLGAGPGKKVGIVGVGGLGHLAIMWAKALGAEVYALSRSESKREDAMKMGAKEFIVTTKENWNEPYKFKFDFILSTSNGYKEEQLKEYFSCLKVMGRFHTVGIPEDPLPALPVKAFIPNGCYMGASHLGNRHEMTAMLELASKQNIRTWVETLPISAENCQKAMKKIQDVSVRYRTTLVDFDNAFGKRE